MNTEDLETKREDLEGDISALEKKLGQNLKIVQEYLEKQLEKKLEEYSANELYFWGGHLLRQLKHRIKP